MATLLLILVLVVYDESYLVGPGLFTKKVVRMMVFKDCYPPVPGPLNPSDPIFKKLMILKVINDAIFMNFKF